MVKIVPNQTFLDGRDRFKEGQEYEVDDNLAFYFGRMGWLVDVEGDPQPATVDLDVQPVKHGHKAGEVGG